MTRFKQMQDAALALEEYAGTLRYHASRKRVTHTRKSAFSLIKALVRLMQANQTDAEFKRRFEDAMYNAQIGPTEIRFGKADEHSDEVFIQGTFSLSRLRKLIVPSEAEQMLEVVGKNDGKS